MRIRSNSGFTLIEIAIVIIIIGLVAGGVVGGKHLIHAAELRSVIADVESFNKAIIDFELQYQALPGDLQNAEDYWEGTQGGNGDGVISWSGSPNESLLAWQHMSLAGMIPGGFSGTGDRAIPKENIPSSRIGGGYVLHDGAELKKIYNIQVGAAAVKNYLLFGMPTDNGMADGAVLAPEDALHIDDKMDDGRPGTGGVLARGEGCASGSGADLAYDISRGPEKLCALEFRLP